MPCGVPSSRAARTAVAVVVALAVVPRTAATAPSAVDVLVRAPGDLVVTGAEWTGEPHPHDRAAPRRDPADRGGRLPAQCGAGAPPRRRRRTGAGAQPA